MYSFYTELARVKPAYTWTPARKALADRVDGMTLAYISNALLYDAPVRNLGKRAHKMLVAMVNGGMLAMELREGNLPGDHPISRIGAHEGRHYVIRKRPC